MSGNENILLDNDYISRISNNSIKKVQKKTNNSHSNLNPDLFISTNDNSITTSTTSSSSIASFRQTRDGQEGPETFQDGSQAPTESGARRGQEERGSSQEVRKLKIPDCSICREYLTRNLTVVTVCGHVFHKQCIDAWLSKCDANKNLSMAQGRLGYLLSDSGEPTCPLCRVPCSALTLCDLVNITVDEALVLEDSEEKLRHSQRGEGGGEEGSAAAEVGMGGGGECVKVGCRLKLRSLAEELEARSGEAEELRAQLGEEKKRVLLGSDLCESLERKNEVLREDLNRVTRELGEMNQRHSDLHRRFTLLQSNSAISSFMGEALQEDLEQRGLAGDGQTAAPGAQEDEASQISNLIGFNPFEGEDSAEKREDAFQALRVLSGAFIKLSGRYDQLKEKSSKWRAKCYQLKDAHTSSINECNFLKERLRSLSKTLRVSETRSHPGVAEPGASSSEGPLSAAAPSDPEARESFSYISKLIQDKKSRTSSSCSSAGAGTGAGAADDGEPGNLCPVRAKDPRLGLDAKTRSSTNEDSPDPNYSSLVKGKRNHATKRNIPTDSQSISSFFYTRKPRLKLVD